MKVKDKRSPNNAKLRFRRKLREYNKGNEFIIISMSGKATNQELKLKGTRKGRPTKQKRKEIT